MLNFGESLIPLHIVLYRDAEALREKQKVRAEQRAMSVFLSFCSLPALGFLSF